MDNKQSVHLQGKIGLKLTNDAQDHWKFHCKGATRGQKQSHTNTSTHFDMRDFKHIIVPVLKSTIKILTVINILLRMCPQ